MSAPFRVKRDTNARWILQRRDGRLLVRICHFDTPGEAIDYAYRNWPWWP